MTRARRAAGSATVLAVGLVAMIVVLTSGAALVGQVVIGTHRARAAADLAALAGAGDAVLGEGISVVCAHAGTVAAANGASVGSCRVSAEGVVDLTVHVPLIVTGWQVALTGTRTASASARAGPAPDSQP